MLTRTRRLIFRGIRITLGTALFLVGVLGLFLPVLQGLLFIALGVGLVLKDLPWLRRWLRPLLARARLGRRCFRHWRASRRAAREESGRR